MSPDIVPALFTPDTDTVNKLVISVLIPTYQPKHWFSVSTELLTTPHRGFTFVQLLYPFLTDFPILWAFSLLTPSVQYQPLEREAPWGGLETLPSKANPRDQPP